MTEVWAVIPTYRPPAGLLDRVHALRAQVDGVVIVDDGSPAHDDGLWTALRQIAVVDLQPRNAGIAAALNAGVRIARDRGTTHLLTVDQDSALQADYVQTALAHLERLRRTDPHAAIIGTGSMLPIDDPDAAGDDRVVLVREALQSGMLLDVAVLDAIGGFAEDFFIDCVDTEFVLRAAAAGFTAYSVGACVIRHALGETLQVRFAGRSWQAAYHPPFRWYYIVRNRTTVLLRHARAYPWWARHSTYDEVRRLLSSALFGHDRSRIAAAAALGLGDALRHRGGPLTGRRLRLLRKERA